MIVKNDMKKVTLLIPVYNEEAMLPTLYQRLIELVNRNAVYEWEILFVNDGSSDTTLECLRRLRQQDKRVNYVNLSRNFGKEVAMLAGFDYATGDCCVVMDADLQDPPELVDQMLEYWEEGYDDIYAKRRTRGEESWLRRQFSLAFYGILQRMSRIDILPNVGDFRLLDRRCVLTLRRLRECERYTKGLFCGLDRGAVPVAELSEEEALRFLRKQEAEAAAFAEGMNLVTHGGAALGFAKRIQNRVNNMYPNSLRIFNL